MHDNAFNELKEQLYRFIVISKIFNECGQTLPFIATDIKAFCQDKNFKQEATCKGYF